MTRAMHFGTTMCIRFNARDEAYSPPGYVSQRRVCSNMDGQAIGLPPAKLQVTEHGVEMRR
jgi:hypothetical protein